MIHRRIFSVKELVWLFVYGFSVNVSQIKLLIE
jgi:hypothetical protein